MTIEDIALEYGRHVNEWPDEQKRGAVEAFYRYGVNKDIRLYEAMEDLFDTEGNCLALLAIFADPSPVARQAAFGLLMDKAFASYGLHFVEKEVEDKYDEWKAADRAAQDEAMYDARAESNWRRDKIQEVPELLRSEK